MTSAKHSDRRDELLVQRATEGLDPAEAAELASLGGEGDLSFELAAASVELATLSYEPMPAHLAAQLDATAAYAASSALAAAQAPAPAPMPAPAPANVVPITAARRGRSTLVAWTAAATGIAAAAAAILWVRSQPPKVITREVATQVMTTSMEPAVARADLLASATDVKTLAWSATPDAAAKGASGDVVWSPSKQRGYMRFVGLAPNDPKITQYQLWIFDKGREDAYPVDGGVFDVSSTGEVIVPISAKLAVGEPVLFAVTVEAPGGVVVSKRERIVVTAKPG